MEELGFICHDGAKIADFLTGVTVPTERQVRPVFEMTFPRGADDILQRYHHSPIYAELMDQDHYSDSQIAQCRTMEFQACIELETSSSTSQHTVNFAAQVWTCIAR